MLTTAELVSEIKLYYAPEWDREVILNFIKRAQEELTLINSPEMIFYNGADPSFPVPFLQTVAGQLQYTIGDDGTGASNILDSDGNPIDIEITRNGVEYPVLPRRVKDIFTEYTHGYSWPSYGQGRWFTFGWFYNPARVRNFYRAENVVTFDRKGSTGTTIRFMEDPGATTDRYYIMFYHDPIELLSDQIPLTIDGNQWHQALIDGAVGFIEDIENGNSRRLEKFRTYWIKKFCGVMAEPLYNYRNPKMKVRGVG